MTAQPDLFGGKADVPETPSDFDLFWEAYPRRVGKLDAQKAWRQTSSERPPIDVVIEKIERLLRTRQWREAGGRFIPHPATWLRRGGWADEVGVSRPSDGRRESSPEPRTIDVIEPDPRAEALWGRVVSRLQDSVDPHSFNTWIRPTVGLAFDDRRLQVAVPNDVFAEWLSDQYQDAVDLEASDVAGEVVHVEFVGGES